jgi:putative ABC transport system permease protein
MKPIIDMQSISQDIWYALRMLAKAPIVTIMIVLSLGIGIGANSAVFSVVDALLLRPLPYPEPERLAAVWLHSPGIGIFRDWPSPGQYSDLLRDNQSFEAMSLSFLRNVILTGRDQPEVVGGMRTTSGIFGMLGAHVIQGRLLVPEDEMPGKAPVAVISYSLWQRFFGADPQIIGKGITVNGSPATVGGVLSPDFTLNTEVMPAEVPAERMDLFLPLQGDAGFWNQRTNENFNIMVRLKRGVSIQQAQSDVDVIASRIREIDKRHATFGMTVTGLQDQVVGDVRRTLFVAFGSVALVLLIACANVANLLLARSTGRQREMAVRAALGAGRQRLIRQLLTESLLLATLGGMAGLAIAQGSLTVIRALNPGNIPRLDDVHINLTVVAFTLAISILTGILFGLAPAFSASRLDVNNALKAGGRTGHDSGGLRLTKNRLRGLLVMSELALSLILLAGAGLLIRSFYRVAAVHPGFSTDHIISMQALIHSPRYQKPEDFTQFYRRLAETVAQVPGVTASGMTSALPLTGTVGWTLIGIEGYPTLPGQEVQSDIRVADSGYFATMQIPLIKGRMFSEHDTSGSQTVGIIDEKFAQRFWPNADPVGKRVWFTANPKNPIVIVGVVGNVKYYGLDADAKMVLYLPTLQNPGGDIFVAAHAASDPAGLAKPIVAQIHALDPSIVVHEVRTMQERLDTSLARRRFSVTLLGAFAVFAMMLSAIGLYGLLSYLVTQNTYEIGIRLALGAHTSSVIGMVFRQGLTLAAAGIVVGLASAAALTRLMTSLLFDISALDPISFASVALILGLVSGLATLIPACRVTRIDPAIALRQD